MPPAYFFGAGAVAGGVAAGAGVGFCHATMYPCPNVFTEHYDVFTNAGPCAAFRAPGQVQGIFTLEQILDEIAERIGTDPVALRDKVDTSGTQDSQARAVERRRGLKVTSSLAGRTREPAPLPGATRSGGFGGIEGLIRFIRGEKIDVVIDATHPYAEQISRHAVVASRSTGVPLVRLEDRAVNFDHFAFADNAGNLRSQAIVPGAPAMYRSNVVVAGLLEGVLPSGRWSTMVATEV